MNTKLIVFTDVCNKERFSHAEELSQSLLASEVNGIEQELPWDVAPRSVLKELKYDVSELTIVAYNLSFKSALRPEEMF